MDNNSIIEKKRIFILFDALDRLASDWGEIRPIAKALFQLSLDMLSCNAVRLKIFVRSDMIEDRSFFDFPDASKLLAKKVSLRWRRADLFALMFQCLGNAQKYGKYVRDHAEREYDLRWKRDDTDMAWILPESLRQDEGMQETLFHAFAGPAMASGRSGHKRGFPYTWLPNRLADGREQVSPRSFFAALRKAAEDDSPVLGWPFALNYKGLNTGVQEASKIRVYEVREDIPWVDDVLNPLRSLIVPCDPEKILRKWETEKTVEKLSASTTDRLLPQHLEEGTEGLLKDLQYQGIIQILKNGRVQMPDVYRVGFGLGRKGGVRPVK